MKKDQRIKKDKEFQIVFKKGESFANRQLVLYCLQKNGQKQFRIGLSVSAKVGNAVVRNRIKRYLRQSFIEIEKNILCHYDFVIIARNPTAELNYFQIKSSLLHVLRKASMINKKR